MMWLAYVLSWMTEKWLNWWNYYIFIPDAIFWFTISYVILYITRESLSREIDSLMDEERMFRKDLSNFQMRWHAAREEKLKASNVLHKFKKVEEDLISLAEEKSRVDLDEKVSFKFLHCQFSCMNFGICHDPVLGWVVLLNLCGCCSVKRLVETISSSSLIYFRVQLISSSSLILWNGWTFFFFLMCKWVSHLHLHDAVSKISSSWFLF